jgi:hypothetical protein
VLLLVVEADRPPRLEQVKATGFASEASTPAEYQGFPEFFSPIPDPSHIDDWLAQDTESRESYSVCCPALDPLNKNSLSGVAEVLERESSPEVRDCFFLELTIYRASEGRTVVYLQPIGPFTNDAVFSLDALASFVKTYYPATVVQLLDPLNIDVAPEQRSLTVVRVVSRGTSLNQPGFRPSPDHDTGDRAPRPTRVPLEWRRSHEYDSHALTAAQLAKGYA